MKKVKFCIPATTANFGSGFDCVGAALKLYNEIEVEQVNGLAGRRVNVEIIGEGKDILPRDEKNIVWQAMNKVFNRCKMPLTSYHIRLTNNIPLLRGLGSSAAARLGGLLAANYICGNKLSKDDLLNIAVELEGHPDNVVPALFGGFCISYNQGEKIGYMKIILPEDLVAIVCIPNFEVSTVKARDILPAKIPLQDAVFNCSRVALLIASIIQKKYDLLSVAMENNLHQKYRSKLIPHLKDVFKAAKTAGALGVALSGSGSSILAISNNQQASKKIGEAMQKSFRKYGVVSRYSILNFDNNGARIVQ
ncbi:MAG: homoserine kinase [Elusimicrobiota bacterium]|nr:homoserine kinase [Elusimicrobiota bacterium]